MPDLAAIINKIQESTKTEDNCWCYNGPLSAGHGVVCYDGVAYKVHRISAAYFLNLDLQDESVQVNHAVDCPNRNCWNPIHIYIGTPKENMLDKQQTVHAVTGLWGHAKKEKEKTHCPQGHEYTPENTKYQGNKRKCRECDRVRKRQGRPPRNMPTVEGIRRQYSNLKSRG